MTVRHADCSSLRLPGLRVGLGSARVSGASAPRALVHHMDHLLLDRATAWPALQPDVVLQLGGRLTSKRLGQFLEWAALGDTARCVARPHTLLWPAVQSDGLDCVWLMISAMLRTADNSRACAVERVAGAPEYRAGLLVRGDERIASSFIRS